MDISKQKNNKKTVVTDYPKTESVVPKRWILMAFLGQPTQLSKTPKRYNRDY